MSDLPRHRHLHHRPPRHQLSQGPSLHRAGQSGSGASRSALDEAASADNLSTAGSGGTYRFYKGQGTLLSLKDFFLASFDN